MGRNGIDLTAHLMRRAGFGVSRGELERLSGASYEDVVEQLLSPEEQPDLDKAEFYRQFPDAETAEPRPYPSRAWASGRSRHTLD